MAVSQASGKGINDWKQQSGAGGAVLSFADTWCGLSNVDYKMEKGGEAGK